MEETLVQLQTVGDALAALTRDRTLHKMTPEQWQAVNQINSSSLYNLSRVINDSMRDRNAKSSFPLQSWL